MASPSALPVMSPDWAAESNLTRILAVTGIFHFLAWNTVGLHLYARIGLLRLPGKDGVVIVGTLVCIPFFTDSHRSMTLTQSARNLGWLGLLCIQG
jgi:hypothetical protein